MSSAEMAQTSTTCKLLRLPQEVLDPIYNHLPQSDKLSIMKSCRKIHDVVSKLLYKEATYRMFISFPQKEQYKITRPPSQHIADQIQYLEVYWYLRDRYTRPDFGSIEAFLWRPDINRKSCTIHLGCCVPIAHTTIYSSDFDVLATLVGFDEVVFRIEIKDLALLDMSSKPIGETGRRRMCEQLPNTASKFHNRLSEELKSALGPAVDREDEKGRFLKFRPRNNAAASSYKPRNSAWTWGYCIR